MRREWMDQDWVERQSQAAGPVGCLGQVLLVLLFVIVIVLAAFFVLGVMVGGGFLLNL